MGEVTVERRVGISPENINPDTPYIGLKRTCPSIVSRLGTGTRVMAWPAVTFKFKQGDILFGKLRPYFHKVVICDTLMEREIDRYCWS